MIAYDEIQRIKMRKMSYQNSILNFLLLKYDNIYAREWLTMFHITALEKKLVSRHVAVCV